MVIVTLSVLPVSIALLSASAVMMHSILGIAGILMVFQFVLLYLNWMWAEPVSGDVKTQAFLYISE